MRTLKDVLRATRTIVGKPWCETGHRLPEPGEEGWALQPGSLFLYLDKDIYWKWV